MRDTLIIKDLVADCRLGVFEWEQAKPQPVWVDLELAVDAAAAAAHDDIEHAVDYGRLVTTLRQRMQSRPYRLLETMAEDLATLALATTGAPRVRVRVKKRALPGVEYAAVDIQRESA
jgi:FolB domain-containing protein